MLRSASLAVAGLLAVTGALAYEPVPASVPLAGTEPLTTRLDVGSIASQQVEQVIGYFRQRITEARELRDSRWQPDFASHATYEQSLASHRVNCRAMLGLVDCRVPAVDAKSELVAEWESGRIERITIPMFSGLSARGLLFSPATDQRHPVVIVCADATEWPDAFAGLSGDGPPPAWLGRLLARGAIVYLPQSIERLHDHPYCKTTNNKDRRMILYRLGYCVGRTMPGLDVQETLAAIDYFTERSDVDPASIGLVGIGQGGMTALFAAALDRRIRAVAVADYFETHDRCSDEPVDRRLPGRLLEFGDAELAALIAPRPLWIVRSQGSPTSRQDVMYEARRAARFYDGVKAAGQLTLLPEIVGGDVVSAGASRVGDALALPKARDAAIAAAVHVPEDRARAVRDEHFEERIKYLRDLIEQSEAKREKRWSVTARPASDFKDIQAAMLADYRKLVGSVSTNRTPLRPRTELALVADKYKAYRVMLDVTEGVELYGNLLVPKNISGRVPAVIAQHGLSGTPEMVTGLGQKSDTAYHEFGRHLAEHGYVVFAPFIMHRRPTKALNDQVRLADAVGRMRVAMAVAKTQRTIDFLQTLPFVDPERIGYYGLSYGGYSALWIAPLVDRLKVIVPSGHFNDWRSKITADYTATSYLRHPDEDFYNGDVLHHFTHVELITMMAPRPVCIEFGQRDGITTPEWTAYAWKQLSAVRDHLGLAGRIQLAHYDGVHEIHGVETFDFLDRFLRPERAVGRDGSSLVEHVLDRRPGSRIRGRFWIPSGAKELRGMAVRLSHVGQPGSMELGLGSAPGKHDLGVVALPPDAVPSSPRNWCSLWVEPQSVRSGQLVYFEITCSRGTAPADHYVFYGPRPLGGKHWGNGFGLSYRVLTD
ncbi:MAG: prolyl oligopeptidase family serine peptidase [Pirellulaceae bacterium]